LGGEFDPIGVVDEPIEEGVGQRRVAESFMAAADRDLSGNQGRAALVAIVEDLEDVSGLGRAEGVAQPVVQDQKLGSGDRVEELGVGAVGAGEIQGVEQP